MTPTLLVASTTNKSNALVAVARPCRNHSTVYMCHGRKHPGNVSRTLFSFRIVMTRLSCWLPRGFEWKWHSLIPFTSLNPYAIPGGLLWIFLVWLMYETPQVRRLKSKVPNLCRVDLLRVPWAPALSAVLRSIVDADVCVVASWCQQWAIPGQGPDPVGGILQDFDQKELLPTCREGKSRKTVKNSTRFYAPWCGPMLVLIRYKMK